MLTKEQKDVCHQAIEYYGFANQKLKCLEELQELKEVLEQAVGVDQDERIIDEIADVTVMIYQ